ncbi:MAG: Ig-like domain-containing protein [Bdellovibrionales bacterium]|nr:Ig-like domain-containing protein [Bdellovibrionales bacterium]
MNFKSLCLAGILSLSTPAWASYTIDKTVVQTQQGQRFFSLELNNVIDLQTAQQLVVTDPNGEVISGRIELIPDGTVLKTSIVQFYPDQQDCFKKVVTLQLGEVSTRIVPGTSGISGSGGGELAAAGFAYEASAAASIISGYSSGQGVGILDVIPRHGTQDASPYAPLMVFFGDIIDTDTVTADNLLLKEKSGEYVSGQIGYSTSTAGNTIVTFTPNSALKPNTDYVFEVNADLKDSDIWEKFAEIGFANEPEEGDDDPKTLSEEEVLEKRKALFSEINGSFIYSSLVWIPVSYREVPFKTGSSQASSSAVLNNLDFKAGNLDGYSVSGGVQVASSFGSISVQSKTSMDSFAAAVTTHAATPVSTDEPANGNNFGSFQGGGGSVAGALVTAEIQVPAGAQWLAFDTNFITAEFPNYVGSIFDDTYLVNIRTPLGVQTINVASVNSLGLFKVNEEVDSAPGLISSLDKFKVTNPATLPNIETPALNGETTWHTRAFYVGGLVGQKITLSFHITNVGDSAYQSVALIDNIRFVAKQPSLKSENLEAAYTVVSSGLVSEQAQESVVTVKVDGQVRAEKRYVLSQVVGTDSFKLSIFTSNVDTKTYIGQRSGDSIQLSLVGPTASKVTLSKVAQGYMIDGLDSESEKVLNQESYDFSPILKLVDDKRRQLSGDQPDGINPPIFPIVPFNE